VAATLGRRWLAGDSSPAAIAATRRRLLALPDRGGGFEVAALDDAMPPPALLDLVIRRIPGAEPDDPGRICLDGSIGGLRDVVAWAVGSRPGDRTDPFVASSAAARDAWTGDMATTLPAGDAVPGLTGRAWTASGAAIDVPVTG
jgi:hypothetical protein